MMGEIERKKERREERKKRGEGAEGSWRKACTVYKEVRRQQGGHLTN